MECTGPATGYVYFLSFSLGSLVSPASLVSVLEVLKVTFIQHTLLLLHDMFGVSLSTNLMLFMLGSCVVVSIASSPCNHLEFEGSCYKYVIVVVYWCSYFIYYSLGVHIL